MGINVMMFFLLCMAAGFQARTLPGPSFNPSELDFSGYCSDESIPTGSSYWTSLNQTLTDLIQNTPLANNMTYTVKNGGDDVSAYGQAQCFNLHPDSCKACLEDMVRRAWKECGDAIAAMLLLKDKCTIRYAIFF